MKEAGKELVAYLKSKVEFTEAMASRIYPLIAPSDVDFPFSIYGMYRAPISKDGDEITFTLTVYFKPDKYDDCVDFMDKIKPIISEQYDFQDDTIEVLEDGFEYMGTITFKT